MDVAIIKSTGKKIYASDINDPKNDAHCWFSHPDGNSYECAVVMDNKQFREMLKSGLIEESQLKLFPVK